MFAINREVRSEYQSKIPGEKPAFVRGPNFRKTAYRDAMQC
jgi:hypothetical protein